MFLKDRNISSKIKRSKVTDYAALIIIFFAVDKINNRHLSLRQHVFNVPCNDHFKVTNIYVLSQIRCHILEAPLVDLP